MRYLEKLMFAAGLLALLAATITAAEAQGRRDRGATPTVVIKKRSFLDSGTVVPVGSLSNYVNVGAAYVNPPYGNRRSAYGRETLPRRVPNSRSRWPAV